MQNVTDNIVFLVLLAMTGMALLVVSFIVLVIYNNNKMLRQKKKLQEAEIRYQQELLFAVIDSQEKERQRIGTDLHDEVGATLSALRLIIEDFISNVQSVPEADLFCQKSKFIIDDVISTVRNISHDLSPLGKETHNLRDALEDLMDKVNQSGKIHVQLETSSGDLSGLTGTASLALYRVFSELINNTIKHAQASNIVLSVNEEEQRLLFCYKDDGIGLSRGVDNAKQGIGMRNIESRLRMIQSDFTINDATGGGFEMNILLNREHSTKTII